MMQKERHVKEDKDLNNPQKAEKLEMAKKLERLKDLSSSKRLHYSAGLRKQSAYAGRRLALCLCLFVLLGIIIKPVSVEADLLWEQDDDFLLEHEDECIYESRSYTVSDTSGYVSVYENPDSVKVTDYLSNSQTWTIEWIYTDEQGRIWGYVPIGMKWNCGWVHMDQLEVVYDYLSFIEDHADQITPVAEGSYVQSDKETVTIWDYPGGTREEKDIASSGSVWNEPISFSYIYRDSSGITWGYVDSFYAYGNFWVRLNDFSHRKVIEETSSGSGEEDTESVTSILSTQRNLISSSSSVSEENSNFFRKLLDSKLFIFLVLAVLILITIRITVLILKKYRL